MEKANRDRLNKLHELQGQAAKNLQAVADRMSDIESKGGILPQGSWDRLWGAWEAANDLTQKIGQELTKTYDETMKQPPAA